MINYWRYLFSLLVLVTVCVWLAVFSYPAPNLKIIACDVGQGDAILATYGQTQILIDGGPDREVLGCLSEYLPFWDRTIEVVVLTHPQKDHYGGLIGVLESYNVLNFVATELDSSSQDYQVLVNQVGGDGSRVINPEEGTIIRVGLIYLDILWPLEETLLTEKGINNRADTHSGVLGSFTSAKDPNEFSVVAALRYKNFNALLTGDISPEISDRLADKVLRQSNNDWEYIKIPHHGSKNGLSYKLLDVVNPDVAVISVGKDNSYGHPHVEILDMLIKENVKVMRTDQIGDIVVETDGEKVWYKK